MQFQKTWVVVANGAMARVFEFSHGKLTELEVLAHPETRMHGHDLVTDKPGFAYSSMGHGRHTMEPTVQPQKNEAQHFSKEVAHYLNHAHRKGSFQALHLIAAPMFLGLLRQDLSSEIKKGLLSTIDKDLIEESPLQIRSYLA